MSKNNYVIPPLILEVLGPPPLLASESSKRWSEALARFAQSFPPRDEGDFEGWRYVWNLTCDYWEEERMKRFKVEILEAPYRARLEQALLARAAKIEDELGVQAFERAHAEFARKYGLGRRGPSDAEAQIVPAVTEEPAPLIPPATDADCADAFMQNAHIYYCADQIQNSARKRYDAVRDQCELRRVAELVSKTVSDELAPTKRHLQSGKVFSEEHRSQSAPATSTVLLSSTRPVTPDASVTETLMAECSTPDLEPPNSPEPRDSSDALIRSTLGAAPVVDLSTTVDETTKSVSLLQALNAPNSPEPQASSEGSAASARSPGVAIEPSIVVTETSGSAPSPQVLAPNSSEPQESSEVSVTPAIEPSTARGEAGAVRVSPGVDTNPTENDNLVTDTSFAARPGARASSPRTLVSSTTLRASVGSVIADAGMPDSTPAAERTDEGDRLSPPAALVQPSRQRGVPSAQNELEEERIARRAAWVRNEKARREAKRGRAPSR